MPDLPPRKLQNENLSEKMGQEEQIQWVKQL